jgi:hypothetical protein
MFGSSVLVQPNDPKALQNLELAYVGPYAVLPPGFNVIERAMPNVASQVLPVVNDLSMLIQNNTGSFRPRAATADGQERTATEVKAQLTQESLLSVSALNLFYIPWGRLLSNMARRLCSGKLRPEDKGGKEAAEFVRRCRADGVPMDVIRAVKGAEPVRSIGYGSPAMRSVRFSELMSVAGAFDEVGKNNLLRDKIATDLGSYSMADRYLPRATVKPRVPVDAQIAFVENAAFESGGSIPVQDGQNHFIHAQVHIEPIMAVIQQIEELPPGEQLKGVQFLQSIIPHAAEHVEAMSADPLHEQESKQFKATLQQADAMTEGIAANLQKMMAQQQQEQQGQGEQSNQLAEKEALFQQKLRQNEQQSQQKLQIKAAEAKQRLVLKDLTAAQRIEQTRQQAAAKNVVPFPSVVPTGAKAPKRKAA